jgi:flagellar biosynthesis protein FlhA
MSLIITAINFIAGVIIGLVQGGMPFSEVLSVYSIATVGDGLVSQIPALLISTATGMIVTRSASEGSLNEDVASQFITQPLVLIIAGITMVCVCFIPGMPKVQPLIVAAILISGGVFLLRRQTSVGAEHQPEEPVLEAAPYSEEEVDENLFYKDVNNVYSLLNIEPIEMEFGYSLIPYVDESSGGTFIDRIVIFRKQFALDMGFVVPSIRLRDSSIINPNQYVIKIMGDEIARGELLVDYFLALEPSNPTGDIDGIEAIEPAYGIPSKWITADKKDLAEIYGYTVIDPMSVMMTHLLEIIKAHAYELMTRAEVTQLLENLKKSSPELVDGIFPDVISHTTLQKVLQNLLKEGIPIKNMPVIIETLINVSATTKDVDIMTENVRTALKRTIVRKFCENGQLKVITLDAEVEKAIIASLNQNSQGIFLALSPEQVQAIMEQVKVHLTKFKDLSVMPVILTTPGIRIYFYRLIEQFYPNVYVLSFNEVDSNIQIQSLGNIEF